MSTPGTDPDAEQTVVNDDERAEATVLLVPSAAAADEGEAPTLMVSKEEALRLAAGLGEARTRPREEDAERTEVLAGYGPAPEHRGGHADPGFFATDPGSPEVSSPSAAGATVPASGALCEASEEEEEFFERIVKEGRGTRRYNLESVRDAGGMGRVLQVLDLNLGRRMAMKILLPAWRSRRDLLSSFTTEARITGFLEHPNIIPVHDLGLAKEAGLYYTMKLVEGESLHAVLRRLRAHDPDTVARYTPFRLLGIFHRVCDALAFAHSNRLLHLDIKPHNVLLGRFGEVFLIDWGLARVCGAPAEVDDPVKRTFLAGLQEQARSRGDQIAGSPAYMSPEQARGDAAAIDERTDIFLMGATLYEMFTLFPPYAAPSLSRALALARRGDIEPPQSRNPERQVPAEIARIIARATARDPKDRHASVAELAAEVDEVMAGRWRPEARRSFAAGDLLMRQGEAATESYVILSGRVRVYTETDGERLVLRDCGPGEMVGEMALVSHEPRSASVEALEATVVAVVDQQRLTEQLDALPPYMANMVSVLVSRLRNTSVIHRS